MRLQSSSNGALGSLSGYVLRAALRAPSTRAAQRAEVRAPGAPPSTFNGRKRRVAVIGGGITGLAAAHRLAYHGMQVTLYEKSSRLGGWLQTEHIPVEDGEVCFEYGPRTIQARFPESLATIDMLAELGLEGELLKTHKDQNAGHARYIYYPDHLVRMPGPRRGVNPVTNMWNNIQTLRSEPLFQGAIEALVTEWQKPKRAAGVRDESIGDFISRRLGHHVADNIFSATFHGIYAGDIYKLSTRAILPKFWYQDSNRKGVVASYIMERMRRSEYHVYHDVCHDMLSVMSEKGKFYHAFSEFTQDVSFFTLKRGMARISAALHSFLKEARNVDIKMNSQIKQIMPQRWAPGLQIQLANGAMADYDFVISTTSPKELGRLLSGPPSVQPSAAASKFLQSNDYAVTVMVVNLYYRTPDLNPVRGFGYVIPNSVPAAENPECALGVVFASDFCAGQDTVKGTKLAVILGGHWWDHEEELPDEKHGIEQAKKVLARHLGITEEPLVAKARLQRNAIPQYTVGHVDRMGELNTTLRKEFDGRLKVAGAWYNGVGVNDCVRAGRTAATSVICHDLDETGLRSYDPKVHPVKHTFPKPKKL